MNFNEMVWRDDRMLLHDLVFRLEHYRNDNWELGDDCFSFYKIKGLVDQYERFLAMRPEFRPRNIFELGMWDGGSVAFWYEVFAPSMLVGVDLLDRGDSPYFASYIETRNLQGRVKTYWKTDQADAERLRTIADNDFAGALDLVIDDASHLYIPSRASFEALYPLVRPGGFYVIEDWAWAHWPDYHSEGEGKELTRLVAELVAAAGSSKPLITSVSVFEGFVAVERGLAAREELGDFRLNDHITHCIPPPSVSRPPRRPGLRAGLGRLRRRLRRIVSGS